MTEIDTDEVRRRYAAGEGIKTLAASYGVANETISRRLGDIDRRRPGRPSRGDVSTDEIRRMHDEDGLSFRVIAEQLGANKSTISRRYRGVHA